jgi:hypothetical protein
LDLNIQKHCLKTHVFKNRFKRLEMNDTTLSTFYHCSNVLGPTCFTQKADYWLDKSWLSLNFDLLWYSDSISSFSEMRWSVDWKKKPNWNLSKEVFDEEKIFWKKWEEYRRVLHTQPSTTITKPGRTKRLKKLNRLKKVDKISRINFQKINFTWNFWRKMRDD